MDQRLTPSQLALYRAVDEVLHYVWDPIGVSRIPEARDEYHAYLPIVFQMLVDGNDAAEVAKYLSSVIVDRIGRSPDFQHNTNVAKLLVSWRLRASYIP